MLKMKLYIVIPMLILVSACFADDATTTKTVPKENRISLWNGPAPVNDQDWDDSEAWITVHHPSDPSGVAVIICPGGGYRGLVTGSEGHKIAEWLNQNGITGVVLEYRLPAGRHAVPLMDAHRAIRTVRSNAKEWKLDRSRIGILGFSAGGHLASTASTHFDAGDASASNVVDQESSRPDFAILVYPVISMGKHGHSGSKANLLGPDPTPEMIKFYSSELQVTADTPPTFLAHALDDKPVSPENSRIYFSALQSNGVAAKYLELPSGGHGLNGYKGPMWDAWQEQSLAWLADLYGAN